MHRRSFVTLRIYWKFLEILYYPRTPVKILDVEGSGLIQAGYHDSWQTDLQQLFKDITTLRFCFKSTAPAESVNSERCRIYREELCREGFFGSYIPLHLHFFRCVERLTIINANPDPATEDIQPPSFEFLMRISSDSELVVHTFHLEGVHINSVNLLRLCKYCHATLKNFSMRRISLLGDWRSVVSDLKKGDVKLRLETFYMRDLWEESAEGVKKKPPAEVISYVLGFEHVRSRSRLYIMYSGLHVKARHAKAITRDGSTRSENPILLPTCLPNLVNDARAQICKAQRSIPITPHHSLPILRFYPVAARPAPTAPTAPCVMQS
ncbi:hypothetical protein P167DRAFT_545276 [Morchella conica CCBAS932]|uniref:Uncharacterized protein n=1 Tax=Morchella conica CCBAS932 TaxID=1392247 RepID=A0A3N4KTE1_9PEZI|nr:hypothetical protein P167DRAFT_545276 [Morchella conica CCBAS932]